MILEKILLEKEREVAAARRRAPLATLVARIVRMRKPRPFERALRRKKSPAVIAEIKRRSPSRGTIRSDFRPAWIARRYQSAGAAALSVLTDRRFFGGSPDALRQARRATRLPVLRKDFLIDEYQIYESRAMGADAVLLIAAALPAAKLAELGALAGRLGLDVLYEIHDWPDWKKVEPLKPAMVGINSRNLRTFEVDLSAVERLGRKVRRRALVVAESGIHSAEDLRRMKRAGARAVLVGEGLMKHADPGRALEALLA